MSNRSSALCETPCPNLARTVSTPCKNTESGYGEQWSHFIARQIPHSLCLLLLFPALAGTVQAPIDTGVVVYQNTSIVRETFQEWEVPLDPFGIGPTTTYYFGVNSPFFQPVPMPTAEQFAAFGAAVAKWNTMYFTYFSALLTNNSAMPDFAALPAATRAVLFGSFGQLLGWLGAQNPSEYGSPE